MSYTMKSPLKWTCWHSLETTTSKINYKIRNWCNIRCRSRLNTWTCKVHPLMDALTSAICLVMTWTVLYMFFDMPPNSELASVVLLVSCSWACGKIAGMFYLPPLLGMLLAGVVLRNTGYYDVTYNNFQPHIINLRSGLPAGCDVVLFNVFTFNVSTIQRPQ